MLMFSIMPSVMELCTSVPDYGKFQKPKHGIHKPEIFHSSRSSVRWLWLIVEVITKFKVACLLILIIIKLCRAYKSCELGEPANMGWNFTNMLFLTEFFYYFRSQTPSWILVCRSMTTHLHTRVTTMNKTRIWYQNLRVLDGCRTFLTNSELHFQTVHFRPFS